MFLPSRTTPGRFAALGEEFHAWFAAFVVRREIQPMDATMLLSYLLSVVLPQTEQPREAFMCQIAATAGSVGLVFDGEKFTPAKTPEPKEDSAP